MNIRPLISEDLEAALHLLDVAKSEAEVGYSAWALPEGVLNDSWGRSAPP